MWQYVMQHNEMWQYVMQHIEMWQYVMQHNEMWPYLTQHNEMWPYLTQHNILSHDIHIRKYDVMITTNTVKSVIFHTFSAAFFLRFRQPPAHQNWEYDLQSTGSNKSLTTKFIIRNSITDCSKGTSWDNIKYKEQIRNQTAVWVE